MLQHFFLTIKGQKAAILCSKSAQLTRGFNSHPIFPSFPHSPSHFQWFGACGWGWQFTFSLSLGPCPSRSPSRAQRPNPSPFELPLLPPLTLPVLFRLFGSSHWLFLFQVAPHQVPLSLLPSLSLLCTLQPLPGPLLLPLAWSSPSPVPCPFSCR